MIMEYRGVEIDGSILKSEKDVDEFLERLSVDRLKVATEIFAYKPTMDMSIYIDELSEKLVNKFGYTWEKIDELEKSCLKNVEKENCETIDLWKGLENQNSLDENIEKAMLKNVKETKKMQQEMERQKDVTEERKKL